MQRHGGQTRPAVPSAQPTKTPPGDEAADGQDRGDAASTESTEAGKAEAKK
jgi:hypothetical protein